MATIKRATSGLTAKRLRELLSYNPVTGEWTWLVRRQCIAAGSIAGHIGRKGRRRIVVDGRAYYSARLAWLYMTGDWPTEEIDHANRVRHDDRWENLRHVTSGLNQANRSVRIDNATQRKGISQYNGGFVARIMKNGKSLYLGTYRTVEEAATVRDAKARELFGEHAS